MTPNTLFAIQDQMSLRSPEVIEKEEELKKIRRSIFSAKTQRTKHKYREQDKQLRKEISVLLRATGLEAATADTLANWDPYDQNVSASFFDPHWMFGLHEGFDIIIGNPPYIRIQELRKIASLSTESLKKIYGTAKGNYDIYGLFIERSLWLLNQLGNLALILPNKFFTTDYGKPIRYLLASKKCVSSIIDFGSEQVFNSATNYTCILLLTNNPLTKFRYKLCNELQDLSKTLVPSEIRDSESLSRDTWIFVEDAEQDILTKLEETLKEENTQPLKSISKISRGSSTGKDDVFVLKQNVDGNLIDRNGNTIEIEREILKKPIYATDFGRYRFQLQHRLFILTPYRVTAKKYELIPEEELCQKHPKAYEYLLGNKDLLSTRKSAPKWYGFSAARSLHMHAKAHFAVPLLADKGLYCNLPEDMNDFCLMAGGGFSIYINANDLSQLYILGLLNSKLLFWLLKKKSNLFRGGWITCTKQYVQDIPIKFTNDEHKKQQIEYLVQTIMSTNNTIENVDTSDLEAKIDQIVYDIYGLSKDEIMLIESE